MHSCTGTRVLWHFLHGCRRPVKRCEQPDRFVATRIRGRSRTEGDGLAYAYFRVGSLRRETACPGGTQGGLNCLTHAPPRCFPTPNRRRMGGGGRLTGRRRPLDCRLECFGSPRTTAVDRRSNSIHSGGPTRSSADFSVPRQRFHAALGSSLIT